MGVPVLYSERHFLPLSPLLRGIVTGASDLQAVLLQQRLRLPTKILPRNACQGQELSSPEVLKSFPAREMRLSPNKSFLGTAFLHFLGAVGRGRGELCVCRSHGTLPLLSSAMLKPQVGIFHLKQVN